MPSDASTGDLFTTDNDKACIENSDDHYGRAGGHGRVWGAVKSRRIKGYIYRH